jgi:hypothetical protein
MSRSTAALSRLGMFLVLATGAACTAAPASPAAGDVGDEESGSSVDELNAGPSSWFRVSSAGGTLTVEPLDGGSVRCAGGDEAPRCAITSVDVRRAGVPASSLDDARSRIATLVAEDSVLVFGRTVVRAATGAGTTTAEPRLGTLRLLAARVFENVARVSLDGELYAVTRLAAPTRCTLARELPSPRGSFAPPMVELFDGTCEHKATRLVGQGSFDLDQPDWAGAQQQPVMQAAAASSLSLDLAVGDQVVVVGRWVSADAPLSRPQPTQVWRDMKHTLAP